MAEIKIEKKKPIWPWILLVLLIILGVYLYWTYNDKNLNDPNETEIVTDTIQEMDNDYNEIPVDTTTIEIDTTNIQ